MASVPDGYYTLVNAYMHGDSKWRLADHEVWRLYDPTTSSHFLTASFAEYTACMRRGMSGEGVAFSVSGAGTVPVYRLYNPNASTHMWTESPAERGSLKAAGWRDEGVGWYGDNEGNVPIYRLHNPYTGEHFFTASAFERDALRAAGWSYENVAFWATGIPALDVRADSTANGVDAYVAPLSHTTSQTWRLHTRPDGTRQLVNRHTGRSLDAARAVAGQNVQQWSDSAERTQSWDVETTGQSITVGRQEGQVCTIRPHGSDVALGLSDSNVNTSQMEVGSTVRLVAADASDARQQWVLLPVAQISSAGVYELRPMAASGYSMDVSGGSMADNANVRCAQTNHSNAQKFWLFDEGDGWSVRNVNSGKYLDAGSGAVAGGTNVRQYRNDASRAQRWSIAQVGSARVDGMDCAVATLGAANGSELFATLRPDSTTGNVSVEAASGTSAQQWALVPTSATDPTVPVPTGLCLMSAVGRFESGDRAYQERLYPGWACTDAWMLGANHYQLRWRSRYCQRSGSWTGWGAWNGWASPGITTSGTRAWATEGIDTSYDASRFKNAEFELQVRCVGEGVYGQVVGEAAVATVRNVLVPKVTFGEVGLTQAGLRIGYSSEYDAGPTHLYVKRVLVDGVNVLPAEVAYRGLDSGGSIFVDFWSHGLVPDDAPKVEVVYQVGNDQVARWTWREWSSGQLDASYDAGTTDIDVRLAQVRDRHALRLNAVSLGGTARAFMVTRGASCELPDPKRSDGRDEWVVAYPFGVDFQLMVMEASADGDSWGVRLVDVGADSAYLAGMRPCHAFDSADGWHFAIELDTEPLSTKYSQRPDYSALVLNGRTRSAVTYGTVSSGEYEAKGVVLDDYEGARYSLETLQRLRHVLYRSPSGARANVAVVGFEIDDTRGVSRVKVSLVEEGD